MPTLLLINPNATAALTARLAEAALSALPGVNVQAAGGRFGAAYISSRASFAVASHAALDAFAEHGSGADAVLLACFGDPGLEALREVSPVPVVSLIDASIAEAGAEGRRFAIVTGGERWRPMLEEAIQQRGLGAGLAAITTVAPTGGQIAADPDGALALLAEACRQTARDSGADAVILGGAGLLGLAEKVEALAGVKVVCSVGAGFRASAEALRSGARREAGTVATPSIGLSPALARLLASGRLPQG